MNYKEITEQFKQVVISSEWSKLYSDWFINQVFLIIKKNKPSIDFETDLTITQINKIFSPLFLSLQNCYDIFCYNFKKNEKSSLKFTKFSTIKRIFTLFIEFLNSNNYINNYDAIKDIVSDIKYEDVLKYCEDNIVLYRDIETIMDIINCILEAYCSKFELNIDEFNELLHIKSIIILMWNGVSFKDMLTLNKRDVKRVYDTFFILSPQRNIEITEFEYKILKKYTKSKGHKSFAVNRDLYIIYPEDDKKLIRLSNKETNYQMIRDNIETLNKICEELLLALFFDINNLYSCGLCKYLYDIIGNKTDLSVIRELLRKNCDEKFAYKFRTFYEKWLKFFYPKNKKELNNYEEN